MDFGPVEEVPSIDDLAFERGLGKARRIITSLEAGTPYWKLHGKRMQFNRYVISIPVGNTWRILAEDKAGRVQARQVLSHSQYNHRLS